MDKWDDYKFRRSPEETLPRQDGPSQSPGNTDSGADAFSSGTKHDSDAVSAGASGTKNNGNVDRAGATGTTDAAGKRGRRPGRRGSVRGAGSFFRHKCRSHRC